MESLSVRASGALAQQGSRQQKGTVSVEGVVDRGLRLRWRHAGKRYVIALGLPDSKVNRRVAQQKATQIEKYLGGTQPTADRLALISRCTGVSADWLVSGEGPMFRPSADDELVRLPIHDISAGAGLGTHVEEEEVEDVIALSKR